MGLGTALCVCTQAKMKVRLGASKRAPAVGEGVVGILLGISTVVVFDMV